MDQGERSQLSGPKWNNIALEQSWWDRSNYSVISGCVHVFRTDTKRRFETIATLLWLTDLSPSYPASYVTDQALELGLKRDCPRDSLTEP